MASKRRIRRKQCTEKKRYSNQPDALSAAYIFRKRFGYDPLHPTTSYKCKFCGGFHIGRKSSGYKSSWHKIRRKAWQAR